jgi:hypothetical protein
MPLDGHLWQGICKKKDKTGFVCLFGTLCLFIENIL